MISFFRQKSKKAYEQQLFIILIPNKNELNAVLFSLICTFAKKKRCALINMQNSTHKWNDGLAY